MSETPRIKAALDARCRHTVDCGGDTFSIRPEEWALISLLIADKVDTREAHNARVTELHNVINAEVERRRAAEAKLREIAAILPTEVVGAGDFSIGGKVWPGLSKLIEECGEVLQVCGKIIGSRGVEDHWDGTNLRARLHEELGDLLAAAQFVETENKLNPWEVFLRAMKKLALFNTWHKEGQRS